MMMITENRRRNPGNTFETLGQLLAKDLLGIILLYFNANLNAYPYGARAQDYKAGYIFV